MQWTEQRMRALEQRVESIYRKFLDLVTQLRATQQGLTAANQQGGAQPSGSGGNGYFGCTISTALAHGASITGQTVWSMPGRTTVTAVGVIYNDGPRSINDIASGAQVILASNSDGSYTVTGVYC
jgi:hypothetical protein